VTIGVIPDFTYNEQGVRLGGTQPGGPAEAARMKQGDIIIQAGTAPISVLQDLSDVLKTKQPGDKLPVRFLRNGKEMNAELLVKER
jgi:S1-C subfamily serine protease